MRARAMALAIDRIGRVQRERAQGKIPNMLALDVALGEMDLARVEWPGTAFAQEVERQRKLTEDQLKKS